MAPCGITDGYYGLVGIPHTAILETIRTSYRGLAVALHPDKTLNNTKSTASFQCVSHPHSNK